MKSKFRLFLLIALIFSLVLSFASCGCDHVDENDDKICDICGYEAKGGFTDDGQAKNGLGAGEIIAIVIGSVLVVGIGGFAIFWFAIKKKSFSDLKTVFKKK